MRRSAAFLGLAALVAAACTGPPVSPVPAGAVPVLLVHGHGTSSLVFDDMIDHLRGRGYAPGHLLAVDLVPPDGSNVAAAEQMIAPAAERLARLSPDGTIDIVAHSMGALSSRWYATRIRPDRVRTLITVGGANHGTDALCGEPGAGAAESCPAFATAGSPVQLPLNGATGASGDETPYGRGADRPAAASIRPQPGREIRYVAVLVPGDRWIQPQHSAELDGADRVPTPPGVAVTQPLAGNLLFAEPTDHDVILQDTRFFAVVDAVLDAGGVP